VLVSPMAWVHYFVFALPVWIIALRPAAAPADAGMVDRPLAGGRGHIGDRDGMVRSRRTVVFELSLYTWGACCCFASSRSPRDRSRVGRPAGSAPDVSRPRYILTYSSAITRWVKLPLGPGPTGRGGPTRSAGRATPRAPPSSYPVPRIGETSSGSEPRGDPMTGVPLASASRMLTGQGSSQRTGIHRHRAPASSSRFRSPPTWPTNVT